MKFIIKTIDDAQNALDYFNHFHDGLIKELSMVSRDELGDDGSQSCTGQFDISLGIRHQNYPSYNKESCRVIGATFVDARNISLAFGDVGECDWNILAISVKPDADRFRFILERNILVDGKWCTRKEKLFTFAWADITEIIPNNGAESTSFPPGGSPETHP